MPLVTTNTLGINYRWLSGGISLRSENSAINSLLEDVAEAIDEAGKNPEGVLLIMIYITMS